ncbi:MAG: hypothetical protein AB1627_08030 [Chloroflexota bacterium]
MLAITIATSGCLFPDRTYVDEVSWVSVDGNRYSGGPSTGYRIDSDDLIPFARATEIHAGAQGDEVFALRAVDPEQVVVMASTPEEEGPYWVFFRDGVLPELPPGATPNFRFPTIPGLCGYLEEPPADCDR